MADAEVTLPLEQETSYSLYRFEQLALRHNPTLAELQAKVDALHGKWIQVGLRPNTHIGFSGQQLFTQGQDEQLGLVVGQTIVRTPKLVWNQQVVCHEIELAEQNLRAQEQRVLTDTRLGYYEVLIGQRRIEILQELAGIAEQSLRSVQSLLDAGEGTRVDLLRATVEQQTIAVDLKNARNNLSASWTRLAAVVGIPDLGQMHLDGDLQFVPQELDREQLMAQLLQHSPEIHAVLAEQERTKAALQRARVEALPDVDVETVIQHDNAYGGTNANFQVTFPIPWRDWNQGGIHEAQSEWMSAQYSMTSVQLNLKQRLATVYQTYVNALQQVDNYSGEDGIISHARQTLELITRAYRAGEIGYLDLLTAQRTFAQTNLLYLDALSELWASQIELEGLMLKGSL